jgi:hypothetical protein
MTGGSIWPWRSGLAGIEAPSSQLVDDLYGFGATCGTVDSSTRQHVANSFNVAKCSPAFV